jgi:hypothetical protein
MILVFLLTVVLSCEASSKVLVSFIIASVGILFIASQLWQTGFLIGKRASASRKSHWMTVAAALAAALWSSERLYEGHLKLEGERISSLAHFGKLVPAEKWVGVTDSGREIELFRWVNYQTVGTDHLRTTAEQMLANCHGWVFAEGGYLLRDADVEHILKDNGYQPSPTPRRGDLIVYRDENGGVIHTGVVQLAVLGKASLIESKWGLESCFVHPPKVQPYGNQFTFYRSARQGHSLAIRAARSKDAPVAKS